MRHKWASYLQLAPQITPLSRKFMHERGGVPQLDIYPRGLLGVGTQGITLIIEETLPLLFKSAVTLRSGTLYGGHLTEQIRGRLNGCREEQPAWLSTSGTLTIRHGYISWNCHPSANGEGVETWSMCIRFCMVGRMWMKQRCSPWMLVDPQEVILWNRASPMEHRHVRWLRDIMDIITQFISNMWGTLG